MFSQNVGVRGADFPHTVENPHIIPQTQLLIAHCWPETLPKTQGWSMQSVYVMHIIYCILIIEEAREMKMSLRKP